MGTFWFWLLLGSDRGCLGWLVLSLLVLNDLHGPGKIDGLRQTASERHSTVSQGVWAVLLDVIILLAAVLFVLSTQLTQLLLDSLFRHPLNVLQVLGSDTGALKGDRQRDALNLYFGTDLLLELGHGLFLWVVDLVGLVRNWHCNTLQLNAHLWLFSALEL